MSTCALRLRRYACRRLSSASVRALVPSSRSLIFFPLTALIRFFSLSESEASESESSLEDDEDFLLFLLFLLPFLLFLLSFLLLLLLFFFRQIGRASCRERV